jgi:hypothetical protein
LAGRQYVYHFRQSLNYASGKRASRTIEMRAPALFTFRGEPENLCRVERTKPAGYFRIDLDTRRQIRDFRRFRSATYHPDDLRGFHVWLRARACQSIPYR